MDWTEADGKTYEEAVEALLLSLGAHRSEVEIEEVGEVKKLFGLGKTVVRVRGRIKDDALADYDDDESLESLSSSISSEIAKIGSGDFGSGHSSETKVQEPRANEARRDGRRGDRRPRPEREERKERPARDERPAREERPPREARPPREDRPERQRHEPRKTQSAPPPAVVFGQGTATEVSGASAEFLTRILKTMGVEATVVGEENNGNVLLNITSDSGGFIIGRKGETLDALAKILEIFATRKKGSHMSVMVDTENYRIRREEKLVQLAEKSAARAIETGKKVRLGPMKTDERKIVHYTLQNNPEVETRSEGSDENRRVVVYPVRNGKGKQR